VYEQWRTETSTLSVTVCLGFRENRSRFARLRSVRQAAPASQIFVVWGAKDKFQFVWHATVRDGLQCLGGDVKGQIPLVRHAVELNWIRPRSLATLIEIAAKVMPVHLIKRKLIYYIANCKTYSLSVYSDYTGIWLHYLACRYVEIITLNSVFAQNIRLGPATAASLSSAMFALESLF